MTTPPILKPISLTTSPQTKTPNATVGDNTPNVQTFCHVETFCQNVSTNTTATQPQNPQPPEKFRNKYRIKSARLQGYDYSSNGAYFITICTANRQHFFGTIIDGKMQLSEMGKIVADEWQKTAEIRKNILLGEWVVMPNHFHGILIVDNGDDEDDSALHYSTPHDMARLAKVFIQYPRLKKIVSTLSITVTSLDGEHEHFLENTNKLLGQGFFVSGIKTGTTENAGECLLLLVEKGEEEYFMVIMGSEDRYTDAKTLLFQLLGEAVQ